MQPNQSEHKLLDPEFEHTPVPKEYRKSLASVAAVWFGFPMVLTSAVIGGVITAFLGFKTGVEAMLVGNLLLFIIVGLLSYKAGHTGLNFALIAQKTFGKSGYYIVSGLLSAMVVGWFAFQVGLTGATMNGSFGSNMLLMTIVGGVLYIAVTYIGIKALSFLGWIAAPMYILMAIIAIVISLKTSPTGFTNHPIAGAGLSFGAAVSLVFAGFADSGTMTADFTRWAKNGRSGVIATMFAFPIANFLAELVGGIVVASGVIKDPGTNGGNFMMVLSGHGTLLTVLSILFVFINLGAVSTHCLYNGAVGWSHMTGKKMRTLTMILGIIGIVAAVSGIWNVFLDWLNLLGVVIPPIAAIIIMDQLVLRRKSNDKLKKWNPLAFITWVLSSMVAFVINFKAPELSVAVCGIIAAVIFYAIGSIFVNKSVSKSDHQSAVGE
ncbi:cytosine permease [Terrilactibacillus laevilacticus]|uniref:cytosine permease n=1 Tax=Terrilactibacillus laevilacticus TaxID=1380157 RepID=UPI001146F43D|nr:cytosine permease [Terrilactibacillus laevilacticus]